MQKKSVINNILTHGTLIAAAFIMIFPMLWMILLSLRKFPESLGGLTDILTAPTTLSNYIDAFSSDAFGIYFLNSVMVAAAVTAGNIIFCLMAAYVFARRRFPMKTALWTTILGVLIIPPHVIMIPLYRIMVDLGWINTYYALIIPWLVTPFGIFLVRQYIISLPQDIEDAARIDGASEFYILFRIVMPLAKPVLTVLAVYTFLANWNTFLFPFLFTNQENYRTLPVGLAFYLGKQSIDWGRLMAGAAMSALPVIILFIIFQKQVIKGMTSGAIKE